MNVAPETITEACRQHHLRYGQERGWEIPYHISLWRTADEAFGQNSFEAFSIVYEELRRRWQAFRNSVSHWSAEQVFDALNTCDSSLRNLRLTDLNDDSTKDLWSLLQNVRELKLNKNGPSVVAISKVLHFWNPKLFVIVDYGMIWNWVFRRWWRWQQLQAVREETDARIFGSPQRHDDSSCDLASYLAVLVWAGRFSRQNPLMVSVFADYVASARGDEELPADIDRYDAAAFEWFLLGLVDLLPNGVRL